MNPRVRIRPATPDDSVFWLSVRNENTVRKWSRQSHVIRQAEHDEWFADSLAMKDRRRLFIIEKFHIEFWARVGVARIDRRAKPKPWTEISIAIAAEHRQSGIGKAAISCLVKAVAHIGWPVPGAVVNNKNWRSLRLFLGAGFIPSANRWIEFRYGRGK